MLMRASSQSLTEQLSARFAQRIRDRLLAPGARLPSVRQCAQQQGVSPATVVAASIAKCIAVSPTKRRSEGRASAAAVAGSRFMKLPVLAALSEIVAA